MNNKELTEGEKKIVSALDRLDALWKKHGKDLLLYNGNSLRKGGFDVSKQIASFPNIRGDGGDGGDNFES